MNNNKINKLDDINIWYKNLIKQSDFIKNNYDIEIKKSVYNFNQINISNDYNIDYSQDTKKMDIINKLKRDIFEKLNFIIPKIIITHILKNIKLEGSLSIDLKILLWFRYLFIPENYNYNMNFMSKNMESNLIKNTLKNDIVIKFIGIYNDKYFTHENIRFFIKNDIYSKEKAEKKEKHENDSITMQLIIYESKINYRTNETSNAKYSYYTFILVDLQNTIIKCYDTFVIESQNKRKNNLIQSEIDNIKQDFLFMSKKEKIYINPNDININGTLYKVDNKILYNKTYLNNSFLDKNKINLLKNIYTFNNNLYINANIRSSTKKDIYNKKIKLTCILFNIKNILEKVDYSIKDIDKYWYYSNTFINIVD